MKIPALVRSPVMALGVAAGFWGLTASLGAQSVPRAVPVEPGKTVPRAIPVEPGEPVPPKAQPASDPNRPTGPDEDLYDYATLCYNQQDFAIAIKPYSDYVRTYPTGRHVDEAWFRLGECYNKTKQTAEAKRAYNEVLMRFGKSPSAPLAAYRMGMFGYYAKDFIQAATYFETCEKLSANTGVKLAAVFNKALCFKYAGQKAKALAAFKVVAAVKGADEENRLVALQEVAAGSIEAGKKEDALAALQEVITATKDDKLLGDSLLRAGLLLNETGDADSAMANFRRVLDLKDLPADKKGMAVFGLIQGNFVKGDYDAVIDTYTKNAATVAPEDIQPRLLLIVGNAYKLKQMYRQAVDIFLMIEKNHPKSPEALDAGYQKLVCFFQLGDKDMPQFAESFEERYTPLYPGHEYLLMSRLIRADWWFGRAEYQKAAAAFSGVDVTKVPPKVRPGVIYKKGFAETEAGKHNEAIATLSLFLAEFPKDPNVPVALAQRGISYKSVRTFDKALADFTAIIKEHPGHSALEMAYYQSGDIKAQTRDITGMIADFGALMAKFPNSPAAAECWYRIGRGWFDLKTKEGYDKALDPLRKAIELDSKRYLDEASQLLISSQYLREDVDGLAKEVDAYYQARKEASISPSVLAFLGERYFKRGDFRSAARYLGRASTPDQPTSTQGIIWNYLGMAELENGSYEAAITALDHFLAQNPQGATKAKALLSKGHALLGLGRFDDADACAIDGLEIVKEGRLHAQLQLLQGDLALARGDALAAAADQVSALASWRRAAQHFVVVSQIFVDPEITPQAADKAAQALEKIGEKAKAESLREQLRIKYPKYELKTTAGS